MWAEPVLTAYDTYKGYTQQQWENEFAREQWGVQQKSAPARAMH